MRWNAVLKSNMIFGFDNVVKLHINFPDLPEEIIIDLSNLKKLRILKLSNCLLSLETIKSLEESDSIEEIIIEQTITSNQDKFISFFEALEKKKTKLKILELRFVQSKHF